MELARDGAALADEEVLADDRLPRVELVAAQLSHARRDLAQPLETQVRAHAVERPQRQRDLADARVAGSLAHAVDRPVDPASAGSHSGYIPGARQAEDLAGVET